MRKILGKYACVVYKKISLFQENKNCILYRDNYTLTIITPTYMEDIIVTDAFGNTLTSGDTVQLTRELSVK